MFLYLWKRYELLNFKIMKKLFTLMFAFVVMTTMAFSQTFVYKKALVFIDKEFVDVMITTNVFTFNVDEILMFVQENDSEIEIYKIVTLNKLENRYEVIVIGEDDDVYVLHIYKNKMYFYVTSDTYAILTEE